MTKPESDDARTATDDGADAGDSEDEEIIAGAFDPETRTIFLNPEAFGEDGDDDE